MPTTENKIRVGENIRVNSPLTDSEGVAFDFSDILTISIVVRDINGNTVEPVPEEGATVTDMTYVVETATLREGPITARINLTYNSPTFPTSFARDILEQELFTLFV